ncbi:uncharacterized protein TNCV_2610701 [Trichonephila clavipes]|nr:uncharacterized protein TNCV_2610701 [Trichonephila clavipes]
MYRVFGFRTPFFRKPVALSLADGPSPDHSSAGWVLDVKNACLVLLGQSTHKYPFGKELDIPSIAEKMSSNTCQLKRSRKIFKCFLKNSINLKYEATSVPQGSVRLVKKTQERKSSTCYMLIPKGVTSSSPVPLKSRRVGERCTLNLSRAQASSCWSDVVVERSQLKYRPRHLTMVQNNEIRLQKPSCS